MRKKVVLSPRTQETSVPSAPYIIILYYIIVFTQFLQENYGTLFLKRLQLFHFASNTIYYLSDEWGQVHNTSTALCVSSDTSNPQHIGL